jgi:hypothetical protein
MQSGGQDAEQRQPHLSQLDSMVDPSRHRSAMEHDDSDSPSAGRVRIVTPEG